MAAEQASARRRLKIGIDIDGVLADIVQQMLPLFERECGRTVTHDDITCYSFSRSLNMTEDRVGALMAEVLADGHFEAAPIVPGAVEGMAALCGHTVWLVTSRPESVREETIRWLARHELLHHHLLFAPAMAKASQADGFDLFVEDNLDAAHVLAAEGIPVLLFDWPWNRNGDLPGNIRRVRDWREIIAVVEQHACA